MKTRNRHSARGFTLIELVVVIIILGILAAVAVAKYVDLAATSRIATLKAFSGALQTAAQMVHAACLSRSECSAQMGNATFSYTFDGQVAQLKYGWPDAGDGLGIGQIDSWVISTGFTPTVPGGAASRTLFTLDGAPDPTNCAVRYGDAALATPDPGYIINVFTTGC